jgi:uncharacterized protein (DUF1501 family)
MASNWTQSSRRRFLIGCSAAVAAMAGSRITNLSFAGDGKDAAATTGAAGEILVVVFLRGGMDGLNLVAPVDDPHYIAARGAGLRLAADGDGAALPLAGGPVGLDFRLHPAAKPLKELYDGKQLAIVHACGLRNGTRSHFEAMDLMERGVIDVKQQSMSTGWLTRHLLGRAGSASGPLPAVGAASALPNSLLGYPPGVAVPDAGAVAFYGDEEQLKALASLYAGDSAIDRAGRRTLKAVHLISKRLHKENGEAIAYAPEHAATYPGGELSDALQTVARLIKLDVGLRAAAVDYGGWDTHQGQSDHFPGLVEQLAKSLANFYLDLTRYQSRLSVIVMSEFGRRLKSNESEGTDHGHGNLMLALGGAVNGGRIYGQWPGLATEQLDDRADLAVTTDHRAVLAELLQRRGGETRVDEIFPGLGAFEALGVFR